MSCDNCGRDDGHYLGCPEAWKVVQDGNVTISTNADVCQHGDCMNPRAVSKGPRPAKYCETHKTGSKKS